MAQPRKTRLGLLALGGLCSLLLGGCGIHHEKPPASRSFSLTEEDVRILNGIKFREVGCDVCANVVLRETTGPAAQPPCPPTTHPGCIWICISDDPLDGIEDSCSTNRWQCPGCGQGGSTVCDPSPCPEG